MNNEIIISNVEPQEIVINGGGAQVYGVIDVLVNGISVVTNNIANVSVPTKTSELENDSNFITSETDPTVPSFVKNITQADINSWNNKQDLLVSGVNIKTINSTSLLGNGNIELSGDNYIAGDGIDINNGIISNTITSYNDLTDLPTIPTETSQLINDSNFVVSSDLAEVAFNGDYNALSGIPEIPDSTSELINDSNFAVTTETNTFTANQNITGDLLITGNSNINKFNTSEIINGKWINDSVIYRKTIAVTLPNNTSATISTGLIDENVINIIGYVKSGTIVYPVNFNNTTTQISTYYNNGNLIIEDNFDGSNYSGYITIEYYKS